LYVSLLRRIGLLEGYVQYGCAVYCQLVYEAGSVSMDKLCACAVPDPIYLD